MNDSVSTPDDLAQLRAAFPGWEIEPRWVARGAAADARYLTAHKGDVTVSAWTADGLAAEIRREDDAR